MPQYGVMTPPDPDLPGFTELAGVKYACAANASVTVPAADVPAMKAVGWKLTRWTGDPYGNEPQFGSRLPSLYLGQVATRCFVPGSRNAVNKQIMSWSYHTAMDDITSLRAVFAAWYNVNGIETAQGADSTIEASVEYPSGTCTRIKFSGVNVGTIPNGGQVVSDDTAVVIPKGAGFWIGQWSTNTSAIVFSLSNTGGPNDVLRYNVSTGTNEVMGGHLVTAATANGGGLYCAPVAIVAQTRRPSIFIAGDSRAAGAYDVNNSYPGGMGQIARAVAQQFGFINAGCGGDYLDQATIPANYVNRLALSQYCSHIISELGINDNVFKNTAPATMAGYRTTFAAKFNGKPVYGCTIPPSTTSTDSWATLANQTVHANNSNRTAFNDLVRAGIAGESGCIDISMVAEDSFNSGKWRVSYNQPATTGSANFATSDGLHENKTMNSIYAQSGVVNPSWFTR